MSRLHQESLLDSYSISKRLSFDLNSSISPAPAKRPADDEENALKRPRRDDISTVDLVDESFSSNSGAAGMSPWESRRLKVDLIEARGMVSQLKMQLQHQHQIKANLETMYQGQVDGLTKQVDYTAKKVGDLEKHVQALRKRESTAKEDLVKARNALTNARKEHVDQVAELKRTNQNLEETLQCMTNDLRNEISNLNRDLQMALQNLSTTQDELEAVQVANASMQERLGGVSAMEKELEEEKQKHQAAQLRVKDLQFQLDSYGEWQEVSRSTIRRLSGMGDLDKEVVRLRADLKALREAAGNKLLLEEQVFDLQTRLERQEKQNVDAIQLQVQVEQLQRELNDWRSVAADHCQTVNPHPITLRTRIEEILKTNLVMSSEKYSDTSERNSFAGDIQRLTSEKQICTKEKEELKTRLNHRELLLQRVQKKLKLVVQERDCYKQIIDHYDKEVTISGPTSASNPDSEARLRITMLEKALEEYKEFAASLEKDLAVAKGAPENATASSALPMGLNSEQYERFRRELDEARLENERLRRRKEEAELKLEQLALKTATGAAEEKRQRLKVVHFQGNPADQAYASHQQAVDKLRAEVERLRRTIRKMESDHEEMTTRFNETNNMTCNIREQSELRQQLQSLESKNQHLKDVFKKASQEFREVVYMLFGYRVDRIGSSNYRLSSMYADNEEEYLNFRLNESAQLDLLETNYSVSLADMLRPLASHHSLPVFLSTLTLDLFHRATVTIM